MWKSVLGKATCFRGVAGKVHVFRNLDKSKPVIEADFSHLWTRIFPQMSDLCTTTRCFSQHAVEPHHFESQNPNTVIDNLDSRDESHVDFDENGDALVGSMSSSDEIHETCQAGDNDEKEVYEIHVEQLENVLSLLQSSGDGSLESSLDGMGLTLHEEFVVKVCETPFVRVENLIRFFNWALKNKSFNVTTRAVELLVRTVCGHLKKKQCYFLWDLVKDIGEKENGLLNEEILNQLIVSFSKLGKGQAAFEVFNKYGEFGCTPNAHTYYYTIEALCRRSFFDPALSICEKMLDAGNLPESEKVGKIISWFCKGEKAKDAHVVYLLAKDKKQNPPLSALKFLIGSLCRNNETVKLASEMLNDFSGEAKKYAIKPFSAVVYGMCRAGEVYAAEQLVLKMIAEGPPPGNAVFNSVITGYAKAGEMKKALEVKTLMESRGLRPDVYTYTVIMSGYSEGGQMEEACKVLTEAKEKHSKLSPVTYHTLIRGFCKLELFEKATQLLSEMKQFGVQPNVDEYEKLIQSLCLKALDWKTAEKLLKKMKRNGLHLKGITRALIRSVKDMEKEELESGEISAPA